MNQPRLLKNSQRSSRGALGKAKAVCVKRRRLLSCWNIFNTGRTANSLAFLAHVGRDHNEAGHAACDHEAEENLQLDRSQIVLVVVVICAASLIAAAQMP
jgi:hypothetical protein